MLLRFGLLFCLLIAGWASVAAEDPSASIKRVTVSHGEVRLDFPLYPAARAYKVLRAEALERTFVEDRTGSFWGGLWSAPAPPGQAFFRLQVVPMENDALLTTTLLNRLAYGPTPDELERLATLGPTGYIQEQLAPELIQESLAIDDPPPPEAGWEYVTITGRGSSSTLYVYLNSRGEGYIDDLSLVAGTSAGVGPNLIRNGGFEAPLSTNDWTISENHSASAVTTEVAHSGTRSLRLIAASPGTTQASAIWQTITPALSNNRQYTLSYWFLRSTNRPSQVTVRLSGSGINGSSRPDSLLTQLTTGQATIETLRSWHIRRAVESKRQLLEVLLQFLENHFVTQYTKSREHFDQFYSAADAARLGTEMEFRELQYWRAALLNPQCTFYDLLKISAESPAMIIYLDTVTSRGDGRNIANENYARELVELFTFGVDNGYDQADIVEISKAWTGWRVELLAGTDQFNPFAPRLVDQNPDVDVRDLNGIWTFKYRPERHNNSRKVIFAGKRVPDRFGPPYAGRSYELILPSRSGTEGIKDGYDIIRHLADQPFTQEFISVKLCQLFVHDDFHLGYDFNDPGLSSEGQLVRQCMAAWENSAPKGQIRVILEVIFHSKLFQSHRASQQKVKTPLEFVASALRVLRSANSDSSFTVQTDGNLGGALDRMGGMRLFDRADPDGYPEYASPWISAGTLAERLRFVQAFLIPSGQSGRSDAGNSFADPVALLKSKQPPAVWNDAAAIADFFLRLIYPAEGEANLALYRRSAIDYLNTGDDGASASPFSGLSNSSASYDLRVRGMVAMLMTFQRFHEQ